MFIPITAKLDAQTVGSACTYARRYSLQMIVGIAPIDDDGNAAVSREPTKPAVVKQPLVDTISRETAASINTDLKHAQIAPEALF